MKRRLHYQINNKMKNNNNKVETKVMNAFTQSMDDVDYIMLEQYQEDQIAELQIFDDQVEEAMTANDSMPTIDAEEITPEANSEVADDDKPIDVNSAPAIVNPRIVKEIYDDFMNKPYSVNARFYNEDGCLVMRLHMDFPDESHEHLIFTDAKFIGLVMRAMKNIEWEKWEEYIKDPHGVMATNEDPRIDIFRQFMNSKLQRWFYNDYISPAGKTYACVTFVVAGWKEIRFCQERTNEINNIIKEAPKTI